MEDKATSSKLTGLSVKTAYERQSLCECCGNTTQILGHFIFDAGGDGWTQHAVTFSVWTIARPQDRASIELLLGPFPSDEEESVGPERLRISLLEQMDDEGQTSWMVVDAKTVPVDGKDPRPRARNLSRDEVIGTPLAAQAFRIIDALWETDSRFRHKWCA